MTETQKETLLTMLKYNLEIITDYMDAEAKQQKDTQLGYYIDSAVSFIEREGITLNYENIGDLMLITMYAQYLYDKRMDGVSVMPRALRYNLNNRLFQEKANEG
jgi:hypothetical protein